jgi:hypothetical protein
MITNSIERTEGHFIVLFSPSQHLIPRLNLKFNLHTQSRMGFSFISASLSLSDEWTCRARNANNCEIPFRFHNTNPFFSPCVALFPLLLILSSQTSFQFLHWPQKLTSSNFRLCLNMAMKCRRCWSQMKLCIGSLRQFSSSKSSNSLRLFL